MLQRIVNSETNETVYFCRLCDELREDQNFPKHNLIGFCLIWCGKEVPLDHYGNCSIDPNHGIILNRTIKHSPVQQRIKKKPIRSLLPICNRIRNSSIRSIYARVKALRAMVSDGYN
jgi:hypothetical protein